METFSISPFLYAKLSYDPAAFVPVTGMGYSDQLLLVPSSSPFRSVQDIITRAKAENGGLQYGTVGIGGSSHINMVLFEQMAGVKLTPVHYRGGAPLVTDLLGGHIPMAFLSVQLGAEGIQSGHIRAVAFATKQRSARFPEVPTVQESGVPGFEAISWYGIFAPKGTPPETVRRINEDVQAIFVDPEFQRVILEPRMLSRLTGAPDEFQRFVDAEARKWRGVIERAGLSVH